MSASAARSRVAWCAEAGASRCVSRSSARPGRLDRSETPVPASPRRIRASSQLWRHLASRICRIAAHHESCERRVAGLETAADCARLDVEHARSDADKVIVTVLQFTSPPAGGDASDLADGLTRESLLSCFSYLRIVKGSGPADGVAAGYVLQGSVRTAGNVVRIVRQLTEAANSRNLWSDSYHRRVGAGSLFDL